MSSRRGAGSPAGDSGATGRGGAGEPASSTPQGSARPVIAAASFLLTLLCVVLAVFAGVANGLLVLATIFAAVFAWAVGAFRRGFWVAIDPYDSSSRLDDLDGARISRAEGGDHDGEEPVA